MTYALRFRAQSCCLVIPTFNNAPFLQTLLEELKEYIRDIIVVNDGSSDATREILEGYPQVECIHFERNRGKGPALRAGFQRARALGFSHALSMDSDSQHLPTDLPAFLESLEAEAGALVVGSRVLDHEHMPGRNRFANRFSSFWYHVETGKRIKDTQSGFRLYPLEAMESIRLFSSRYEFELEALVKASWKGIPVKEIPIDVHYPPGKERISHFRPFRDFLRITLLNFWLVFLALAWYRPRAVFLKYRNKSLRQIIREDIMRSDTPLPVIAASIAFGIFMGILPIWGYQLMVGFFFAHLLKLNKAIFFIAANISIPPMIPLILYLSYVTGSYVLGQGSWSVDVELNLSSIGQNLKQYLTGSVVFALLAGSAMGILSYGILVLIKKLR